MTVPAPDCAVFQNVFLHPLLDDGIAPSTVRERREQRMLHGQASRICAGCPLAVPCLTDAVVKFDVSGFVAGTTRRQREEIRTRLGIHVAAESLDTFTGVKSGGKFDGREIVRLRNAHPNEPLGSIAARVGCSVSTVKRHLRRLAADGEVSRPNLKISPTPAQIVFAAEQVKRGIPRNAAA